MPQNVLQAFAAMYRRSQAGRTGSAGGDFLADFRELLAEAKATDGEERVQAEQQLRDAARSSGGMLKLDMHTRDDSLIYRARLAREGGETWLFGRLNQPTPSQQREMLAAHFDSAANAMVPDHWSERWQRWCARTAATARNGGSISPFSRDDVEGIIEVLRALPRLLGWRGESLVRFASCTICGDSKRLEQLRAKLEACLDQLSTGAVSSLDDLGLLRTPRMVLLHGPLIMEMHDGITDFSYLTGSYSVSKDDLQKAVSVSTTAARVLTVENEATFHELAKLRSNTLLIQTSYPGSAVIELFRRLPPDVECWHFGDSDPAGFDILRDLCDRTGREIKPLHMRFRERTDSQPLTDAERRLLQAIVSHQMLSDVRHEIERMQAAGQKGDFEQESLGPPPLTGWPFY